MLRSAVLIVSVAHMAFAGVANVCARKPYAEMHQFKDYEPAKAHCASHYPVHVVTKTAPHKCLTTTETAVMHTDTVTVTRTSHCSESSTTHIHPVDYSVSPVPPSYHKTTHEPTPTHYKTTREPEPTPPGYSKPTGYSKRDENGHEGHEWKEYHERIVKCGYDCVQTACSCIATQKTVTHTPKPTCTTVRHTSAVHTVTSTKIITPPGSECKVHDGSKKLAMKGHHDGHRKLAMEGHHDGHRKLAMEG